MNSNHPSSRQGGSVRVGIFFDGKNFYKGLKHVVGQRTRLDFPSMARWLVERVEGERLWGAYYYTGIDTSPDAEAGQGQLARFLTMLELQPGCFVFRFPRKAREIRCEHCKNMIQYTQEKEVDTSMVADMLRLAAVDAFQILVLVSGDADHAPAVEGVRALGKQVYVATWGTHGLSPRLRKAAFDHLDLSQGLPVFATPTEADRPDGASDAPPPVARGGTDEVAPVDAGEAPPSAGPREASGEAFLDELRLAEAQFKTGYVGASFFVMRWRSSRLDPNPEVRTRCRAE